MNLSELSFRSAAVSREESAVCRQKQIPRRQDRLRNDNG